MRDSSILIAQLAMEWVYKRLMDDEPSQPWSVSGSLGPLGSPLYET